MLKEFSFLITPFQVERSIRVYLPKHYHETTNQRYPVLYMHDGKNVFRDDVAVGGVSLGLEAYLDERDLNLIVIGIDSNPTKEDRVNEYCPWVNGEYSKKIIGHQQYTGGLGGAYIDFIVNELKPYLDAQYRTLASESYMAGISLGGLISTYAACRYPEIFSRVAGISSGFYRNQEEIENLVNSADLSAIERFYLDCGTEEAGEERWVSEEFVRSNTRIAEILEAKIPRTKFQVISGAGHNYAAFKNRIHEVLSYLLADVTHVIPGALAENNLLERNGL